MGVDNVDASNSCVPPSHPLVRQALPLPTATRGEPLRLDGHGGRLSEGDAARAPLVMYAWNKLVVVREVDVDVGGSPGGGRVGPSGAPSTGGFVYRGHSAPVTACAFSPSGSYVASGDARGRLRVWAYDHEQHLPRLDVQLLAGPIRDVSWDADGRRIAATGDGMQSPESGKVVQWDTGVKCGDLAAHSRKKGSAVAFRPGRPMRIATGGAEDATVFFHGGPPFQRVVGDGTVCERGHERGAVHCLRYTPDGSAVASVGTDGAACVYDGRTLGLQTKKERLHRSSCYSCCWSRDGTGLLTCGADGYARLVDRAGGVLKEWNVAGMLGGGGSAGEGSSKVPTGAMQLGCAFVKGGVPVSVGYNGQIAVLPLEDGRAPTVITGHQAPIAAMEFGGGSCIYTADTDGVIVQWDGDTGRAAGRVSDPERDDPDLLGKVHGGATITSLAYSAADGVLYSAGWDDRVRTTAGLTCDGCLEMDAQPNAMSCGTALVAVMTVDGLALVRDGKTVVTGTIRLPYAATAVHLSRDDGTLYVAGEDCSIHVYRVAGDRIGGSADPLDEVHVIAGGHLKPVRSLSLSPDGTRLAAADSRDVCVYDASDGYAPLVPRGRWCFHTQAIGCLAWSPDGSVLASGSNDDGIFLWCPDRKARRVHYRFAHRGGVTGLRFAKGGDWTLVSSGADGCVNWWDVGADARAKFGL